MAITAFVVGVVFVLVGVFLIFSGLVALTYVIKASDPNQVDGCLFQKIANLLLILIQTNFCIAWCSG